MRARFVAGICLLGLIVSSTGWADTPCREPGKNEPVITGDDQITPDNYEKIKPGMRREQVLRTLGRSPNGPRIRDYRPGNIVGTWDIGRYGELWSSAMCNVWIQYDQYGIVTGKVMAQPKK